MVKVFDENVMVCLDCFEAIAGTSEENTHEPDALEPGLVFYCGDSEKDNEFSWSICEGCKSLLGGSRHHVAILDNGTHKHWLSSMLMLSLTIPLEVVEAGTQQGTDCYEDLKGSLSQVDFSDIEKQQIVRELREVGAWSKKELEEESLEENQIKLLWIACGDINEQTKEDS